MNINGVNFPNRIIEALHKNKLVVFAGAGVSMGEPANLPDFRELATQIAKNWGLEPPKDKDLDYFLGKLNISEQVIRNRAIQLGTKNLISSLVHFIKI